MKRSKHSLSHHNLFTCDMGELIPCGFFEVLPGDTIRQNTQLLVRVSPMLAPVMHPVEVRVHHWFVPHRLVWDEWEDFITGGPNNDNASVLPNRTAGWSVGQLADYLGLPPNIAGLNFSMLPFRGYALIWNEWYRDQDLQAELVISKASGTDSTTSVLLQNAAWEKDYFTSARPWPQKGPDIIIPIGTSAPVKSTGTQPQGRGNAGAMAALVTGANPNPINVTGTGVGAFDWGPSGQATTGLFADLTGATGISVNDLREFLALQRFAEMRARYGSRYVEYLRSLGVRSSDARLSRPEYLGGGRQILQFSEVLQTGVTTDGDDQEGVGNLKGHGIGFVRSNMYQRFFEEHGYVFSLMSVRPKTMYVQGQKRTWNRKTRMDFFQPEYQHIGQQEILNKEIYAAHASPLATFGYQDRYDEYRRQESGVMGEFRGTTGADLDFWHMARIFASAPALNADFVKMNPTKRINAVQTNDVLWCMAKHNIKARRIVAKTARSFIY